ncbi:MAG: tripartite tricarboxylate transporter TctB family protein [Burkholderiales bacterium]
MALSVRHPQDFFAGVIFIGFGVAAFFIGREYSFGTATRMGPGYFPALLGALLGALGVIIAARSFSLSGPPIAKIQFRPLSLVLAAIILFAVLLDVAGLVAATVVMVIVAGLAAWDVRARDVALLCVGLAALALGLFVYGLGLTIKVWPWS